MNIDDVQLDLYIYTITRTRYYLNTVDSERYNNK